MIPFKANIDGSVKSIKSAYTKVNDVWLPLKAAYANIDGVWGGVNSLTN